MGRSYQPGRIIRNSRNSGPGIHSYFPEPASVVAAAPALQSSAIPAKITFGLNSKQHSVRLETPVTSRKQTKETRSNRHEMTHLANVDYTRASVIRRRAFHVKAGRSNQASTRQVFPPAFPPVATQLIISNRPACRLEMPESYRKQTTATRSNRHKCSHSFATSPPTWSASARSIDFARRTPARSGPRHQTRTARVGESVRRGSIPRHSDGFGRARRTAGSAIPPVSPTPSGANRTTGRAAPA